MSDEKLSPILYFLCAGRHRSWRQRPDEEGVREPRSPGKYWPVIGQYWSRDLNTDVWLVQDEERMGKLEDELKDARNKAEDADKQYDEVSPDWSIQITWPEYWHLIGQYRSRDLNTDTWLVETSHVTLILTCNWLRLDNIVLRSARSCSRLRVTSRERRREQRWMRWKYSSSRRSSRWSNKTKYFLSSVCLIKHECWSWESLSERLECWWKFRALWTNLSLILTL